MIPDFPHNIRIRLVWLKFFLLRPDVALSLPCWLSQFSFSKLRQSTGQRQSNVRTQQKKFQSGQSYSYIMRKDWYHQIWIQTCLGFIALILCYTHLSSNHSCLEIHNNSIVVHKINLVNGHSNFVLELWLVGRLG